MKKLGFIFQLKAFLRMVAKNVMTKRTVELMKRSEAVLLDHVSVRVQLQRDEDLMSTCNGREKTTPAPLSSH